MAVTPAYLEFLDEAASRRKRRRLAAGLSDAVSLAKADEPEHPSVAVERDSVKSLEGAKQRKAIAYGLEAYEPTSDSFRLDLSSEYVRSGRRTINFVLGTDLRQRFDEHPKLKRLIDLHASLVAQHAHPPTQLGTDLRIFDLSSLLPVRFDSIIIDAPLRGDSAWSWADIEALPVPKIAAHPSFIWLWVGEGHTDGLERGRELLSKWGYRRCEDITWLKTNRYTSGFHNEPPAKTLFSNVKEHCLMGIRGTVRRSTDGQYVHCNVDTDVIFAEPDAQDPSRKPEELYHLIENFCLGTRRLHLFAPPSFARPGWLAVGSHFHQTMGVYDYQKEIYDAYFDNSSNALSNVVPSTQEIESLRPRTPPPKGDRGPGLRFAGNYPQQAQQQQFGRAFAEDQRGFVPPRGPSRPVQHYNNSRGGPALGPSVPTGPRLQYSPTRPAGPVPVRPQPQPPRVIEPVEDLDLNELASAMGGWSSLVSGLGHQRQARHHGRR